jgi:nucleoside-triphosphatase THEP1
MPPASPARLASIHFERGFEIDAMLLGICDELRLRGFRIGGVIQSSFGRKGQCASSVLVTDLRSGESFDIWNDRGSGARGCRLNENGLFEAEPAITAAIADRVDLLVINRFGRAESLGRGLLASFVAALDAGVPVLTAVRHPYDQAWQEFHAGLGCDLASRSETVLDWACGLRALQPS